MIAGVLVGLIEQLLLGDFSILGRYVLGNPKMHECCHKTLVVDGAAVLVTVAVSGFGHGIVTVSSSSSSGTYGARSVEVVGIMGLPDHTWAVNGHTVDGGRLISVEEVVGKVGVGGSFAWKGVCKEVVDLYLKLR
jgi:hypothetical protein